MTRGLHLRSPGQDLLKWLALLFMFGDHLRYAIAGMDWPS